MKKNQLVSTASRLFCAALMFALLTSPIAADGATAKAATKRKATPRKSATWIAAMARPSTVQPPASSGVAPSATQPPAAVDSELAQAEAILQIYITTYPILAGTTVRIENAHTTYQAITFVGSAEIVINGSHAATLNQIIGHEIWHVIDWRDNGRIDWGERVPPASY